MSELTPHMKIKLQMKIILQTLFKNPDRDFC
jgi:hypothetical protein